MLKHLVVSSPISRGGMAAIRGEIRRNGNRALSAVATIGCMVCAMLFAAQVIRAQSLVATPSSLNFTGDADTTLPKQTVQLTSPQGNVPFVIAGGYVPREKLFPQVDVTPPLGTTPATLSVGPTLKVAPLPHTIASIVNAATLQPGISPGGIFTIFGEHLAYLDRGSAKNSFYDPEDFYVTSAIGGTVVSFNGRASPMLYSDPGQINAVVPVQVAGQTSVDVVLMHYSYTTSFTVPIVDTSPGIFTVSGTGSGQGSILNTNGSLNSARNPALAGSIIQIFGAGAGLWNPMLENRLVVGQEPPFPVPVAPVSVMIGGQPATITYAGSSPGQIIGVLQVNAMVPASTPPGDQPVVLSIGNNSNAQQRVTVAVQ